MNHNYDGTEVISSGVISTSMASAITPDTKEAIRKKHIGSTRDSRSKFNVRFYAPSWLWSPTGQPEVAA